MSGSSESPNRTKLELKLNTIFYKPWCCFTPNRTKLELKPDRHISSLQIRILPIAPSWNWNAGGSVDGNHPRPLPIAPSWNWNFKRMLKNLKFDSPNRTKLELKLPTGYRCFSDVFSPNRTKLELKLISACSYSVRSQLPIAPSWNWNFDCLTSLTS